MTTLDESRVREIVREEVGVAAAVVMSGDANLVSDYYAGLLTRDELAKVLDLALKGHQSTEHPRYSRLELDHSSGSGRLAQSLGLNSIDDRLSDGQVVGNVAKESDEVHSSPSVDSAGSPTVEGKPGPESVSGPGANHALGGRRSCVPGEPA